MHWNIWATFGRADSSVIIKPTMSETLLVAENQSINEPVVRLHEKLRKKYETSFASRQDGKKVPYVSIGDPDGMPVFLIPGSPGSRLGLFPKAKRLFRNDIWLLSFDRSGYGLAPREPGRTLLEVLDEINLKLQALTV